MKYILLLAMMLGSCQISKPRAKKKLDCIVNLYPELIEYDTVTVRDTIITEKKIIIPEYRDSFIIQHDTTFETKEIIVEKRGTKYKFTVKEKQIQVHDTIYKETKVAGKVVYTKPSYENIVIFVLVGFAIGVITVMFKR
jgi:hypothetical protein